MAKTKNIYLVPVRPKDRKTIVSDIRAHNGILKYAIDFSLPIGTPILASQNGTVVDVVDKFNKGGDGKKYFKYLNYITIKHRCQEYSQYGHLNYKSSLVKIGQKVEKGKIIGYSGNTGWTTEPHLHFHVSRDANNNDGWETLKIRFNEKLKYLANSKKSLAKFVNKYSSN